MKASASSVWISAEKPRTGGTDVKSNAGVGKSFLAKPAVRKTRYYIDGSWYDDNGSFITRNKPANNIRNRSGDAKLYKWVLGGTKTGNHCPDCSPRRQG